MTQAKENKKVYKVNDEKAKIIRVKLTKWGNGTDKIPDFRDIYRVAVEEDPSKQKRYMELKDLIPEETSSNNIDAYMFKRYSNEDSVSGVSSDEEDLFVV